ncbi:Cof-type HAD-IIB family hydrolase [Fervidobacterium thailandense]|uniref:Hydrolase Cof n=1 Tax=Fervidobacterium thailandense TaxID=1008305 RepID=A0A1E3G0U7_9BACT|nr:Cof-type HAD-IIB family hydrolase [Fervidobacterium thailandense]ODN29842.1 hydrolase Cof [Fervidobacterium thailandense]
MVPWKIKLIVTDLDGTLLDDDKHIPEENVKALREAMERGVHVSVATGRNLHSAKPYIEELGLDVPVIFQNGAFIYEPLRRRIVHQVPLKSQIAKRFVESARKEGLFYILYSSFLDEHDMYIDMDYHGAFEKYLEQNAWRLNRVTDVVEYLKTSEEIAEIAIVGEEERILRAIKGAIDGFESEVSVVKNNVLGGESFYEIFGPNCSKEEALKFLLNYFGVRPEETMYLGDSFNDIGMLKLVGFPVVVENAHDEVKRYARYITRSNNEAGVAYAIRELLFKV